MANKSEAERARARLVALIEELYGISEQQLSWVKQHYEDEDFLGGFEDLSEQWTKLQSEIQEESARCQQMMTSDAWREVLSETVMPMMIRANDNMNQAIRAVEQKMHDTGATLRTAHGLRQAGKAYHSAGYDEQESIFFDEKK